MGSQRSVASDERDATSTVGPDSGLWSLTATSRCHHTGPVVDAHISRRVLQAIADAHPREGSFTVRRVDIQRGWGDLIHVTIHVAGGGDDGGTSIGHRMTVRNAVEQALDSRRHRVTLLDGR